MSLSLHGRLSGLVCFLAALACLSACSSASTDTSAPGVEEPSASSEPPVKANPDPDPKTLESLPKPVMTDTARLSFQESTDGKVAKLLASAGYDELEKMGLALKSSQEQFTTGVWRLDEFASSLSLLGRQASEKEIAQRSNLLKKWLKARPASQFAQVAMAEVQAALAMSRRGDGWIEEIPQDRWQAFAGSIKEAQRLLDDCAQVKDEYVRWYNAADNIALAQSWERVRYEELYKAAATANKTYNQLYFDMALYLSPRWYGKEGEWEAFAASVADTIGGDDGDVLYAQIVWSIARQKVYSSGKLFSEAKASWPRVVKGFEVMLKTYRNSPDVLNEYLRLSMDAEDVLRSRELFKQIGEKATKDSWESPEQFSEARRAAFGVAGEPKETSEVDGAAGKKVEEKSAQAPEQ